MKNEDAYRTSEFGKNRGPIGRISSGRWYTINCQRAKLKGKTIVVLLPDSEGICLQICLAHLKNLMSI